MKVAVFSTQSYDQTYLDAANHGAHEFHYFTPPLDHETWTIAKGYPCVCVFVNDKLTGAVLRNLHAEGLRLVALRCAGFNNVDLETAKELGIKVVRVPAYSPHAVAEHAVA